MAEYIERDAAKRTRADIANRIKYARVCAKLTQADVAKKLGVTPQAISNYERGTNAVPNNVLSDMAELFNVTSDYLLGITNTPVPICAIQRLTVEPESMTNADCIRAMSDEELATMLHKLNDMMWCRELPECFDIVEDEGEIPVEKCIGCALAWLQQPAE